MINRILTALAGLPVFLFLLYKGGYYTNALIIIMIYFGLKETVSMFKINHMYVLGLLFLFSLLLFSTPDMLNISQLFIIFSIFAWIYVVIYFSENQDRNSQLLKDAIATIFIFGYVSIPLYHIVLLRTLDNGFILVLFMFLIIWSTDTFAYFTGRAFGKHKMAPLISPKKTIEGAIGGSFFALVLGVIVNQYFDIFSNLSGWTVFVMILFLSALSQIGDLFESSLKRIYNVKDSGSILPGHGGVLDRFDSTIFVAPVFYLLITLL